MPKRPPKRTYVAIEEETLPPDDFTAWSETWTRVTYAYAGIRPMVGRELELARQIHAETTHSIEVGYDKRIKPDMRLNKQSVYYHIMYVLNENEENKNMILHCKKDQ